MFRGHFALPFNAVTWPGLLAHIPPEERNGLNLEEFLKNKIDASVFVMHLPVEDQRLLLENWFGDTDSSDLVEAILGAECQVMHQTVLYCTVHRTLPPHTSP